MAGERHAMCELVLILNGCMSWFGHHEKGRKDKFPDEAAYSIPLIDVSQLSKCSSTIYLR